VIALPARIPADERPVPTLGGYDALIPKAT
jgi:hypothetical protein